MTFSSKSCLQMNRSICTITRQTHDRRIVLLGLSKRNHWESSIVQTVLSSPDHVRPKISSNKSAGSAHCSLDLFGSQFPFPVQPILPKFYGPEYMIDFGVVVNLCPASRFLYEDFEYSVENPGRGVVIRTLFFMAPSPGRYF